MTIDLGTREEAERNNERSETQDWAEELQALASAVPSYRNYEVTYRT